MISSLHKYASVYLLGIQSNLVYRWNFFLRALFGLLGLVSAYLLWSAAFQGKETIGGYTLHAMLSYYILLQLMEALTTPVNDDFDIALDIREGHLNQFLLKPVSYIHHRFSLYLATRCTYFTAALVPLSLAFAIFHFTTGFEFSSLHLLHALPAILGSAALQFGITFCMALLAFWLMEVSGPIFILFSLEFLLGGHVFPLDLLPPDLYQAVLLLPFAYQYYFPVAVLTGNITGQEYLHGLAIQWLWVVAIFAIARIIWNAGLKQYTAVGG